MKEKILILGGTEFVGRQLVENLIKDSTKEIYLFNRGKTNPDLFPDAKKIIGDRETEDIKKIQAHQWDYIIDFSSYYPGSLQKTLAQINKAVKKYIYISTISVYALKDYDSSFEIEEDFQKLTCSPEEAVDTTMKTYGQKKVACEQVLEAADWLNSIVLRPSVIYGKYDPTNRLYYWLRKIKKSDEIIVPDNGVHKLSLTFADDLVRIILSSINEQIPNGVYNCSTHKPLAFRNILEIMKELIGSQCKLHGVDHAWLRQEKIRFPLTFGGNIMVSNSKIKSALPFSFTPFRDSIKSFIKYYEEENWKACELGIDDEQEKKVIAISKTIPKDQ